MPFVMSATQYVPTKESETRRKETETSATYRLMDGDEKLASGHNLQWLKDMKDDREHLVIINRRGKVVG